MDQHLAAIRAGAKLKPVAAVHKKASRETDLAGQLARALQQHRNKMQEDNEVSGDEAVDDDGWSDDARSENEWQ